MSPKNPLNADLRTSSAPDEWLTASEVAIFLKLSISTLAKLRVYGGGPAYATFGRAVRYSRKAVDDWARARVRATTSGGG
jgi:excisionase family DNA binding protein